MCPKLGGQTGGGEPHKGRSGASTVGDLWVAQPSLMFYTDERLCYMASEGETRAWVRTQLHHRMHDLGWVALLLGPYGKMKIIPISQSWCENSVNQWT